MQKELIYDSLTFVTQRFTLVKQTNCFVNACESLSHSYVRIFCFRHQGIVQCWLKLVKKETWSHSGRCLVCKQLEFFVGVLNVNWLFEQRTRTINKKCYGPGATYPFRMASERASERRSREGRKHQQFIIKGEGGASPGGTWANFCWVCAAGLSEPLLQYSLFCGQLQNPSQSLLGKYVIFAIPTKALSFNASASY